MDKPSSEEKALERAQAAVRAQIERIVKMSRSMKMEPDLTPVWDGDEFGALPDDARRALAAWAEKEGYAKPERTTRPEKAEEDPRTANVRQQIERIVKMSRSMKMEPDLTPVWDGDEFGALPDDLQASVREWAEASGVMPRAAAPVETAPETAPAVPPSETKERREKKEQGRQKRRFLDYRVTPEADGVFVVEEDYEEWDDQDKVYKAKTVKTSIGFTSTLVEKMAADPEVAATVSGFAGQIRGELDGSGVKIFFDRPKNEPDKIYPKWKYALEGKTVQDPIKIEEIPADVMEEVRKNKEYFKTDAWKKWFGKRMQRKREEIITAELAKLFPERAAEAQKPEQAEPVPEATRERGPEPVREPELAAVTPEPEAANERVTEAGITPELAAGIDMLVDKFTPLFELPKKTEELIAYITQFSKGIFEYQLSRKGAVKQVLPEATLRDAVRASLLEKFSGDAATTAEIRRLMPDRAPAAPAADEDVIEVKDEWIEEAVPEKKKEAHEVVRPAEAAYRALRNDMDSLKDPDEIDGLIVSLKEMKKSGIASVVEAANRLLKDIEYGRAGELSELRTDGLRRSPEEEAFLARHPHFDARNIQRMPDGRMIAHIDRLNPEDALYRVMQRATDDALSARAGGFIDARTSERVAAYLGRIVAGKNPNEDVTRRFARDLAAFDPNTDELTVKDTEALAEVIANLADKIASEGKK